VNVKSSWYLAVGTLQSKSKHFPLPSTFLNYWKKQK